MTKTEPAFEIRSPDETYFWGEQLAEALTQFEYESRAHPRTKLTIEIVASATNRGGSVFGTPFNAITTDISPGGIGFIHTTTVSDKYLAITLGPRHQRACVLVEVVRCRPIGSLYDVGARFLRLLDDIES